MTPDTIKLGAVLDEATMLLKALSHPARLLICCQLRDNEMSVGTMETTLGIKQPRLSRELAKLREGGLIEARRESKIIFYKLSDNVRTRAMIDAICDVMIEGRPIAHPQQSVSRRKNAPGGYGIFARTT
ncbi:MAG: metalloregulator ArsR/SmtB family transcription factor [Parvularculaceae bacterium]